MSRSALLPGRSAFATASGRYRLDLSSADPYAANVTSLLHLDGIDGGLTFTDQTGKVWSRAGTAALSTSSPKWGTAALSVPAASHISTPNHVGFEMGSGDWTVECWIKPTSDFNHTLFCYGSTYGGFYDTRLGLNGVNGQLTGACYPGGSLIGLVASNNHAVSLDAWHHVALVRDGANLNLYLDGVRLSQSGIAGALGGNGYSWFLGSYAGGESFEGLIDDFRVTKGAARYTGATYTVPTAAFPNP